MFEIPPDVVELKDFSRGYMPDLEETAVPWDALRDVNNLLPDRTSGVLETRKGFKRFGSTVEANYPPKSLHPFNVIYGKDAATTEHRYLIITVASGTDLLADNVKLYAMDMSTGTVTRMDTATRPWRDGSGLIWGETIDNTFYGGTDKDPVFSYRPYFSNGTANPEPWEPDATMPSRSANDWAASTAYTAGDRVRDRTDRAWKKNRDYKVGDIRTNGPPVVKVEIVQQGNSEQNEIQKVWLEGNPTGGTFTLTIDPPVGATETTGNIAYDASAQDVEDALAALVGATAADFAVSGKDGGPWKIKFTGIYAKDNAGKTTGDATNLTPQTTFYKARKKHHSRQRNEPGFGDEWEDFWKVIDDPPYYVWTCISDHTSATHNKPSDGRNAYQYWELVNKHVNLWVTATDYEVGDEVAFLVTGDTRFPRGYIDAADERTRYSIFRCKREHTSASNNQPYESVGSTVGANWEPARGPMSGVAAFHGSRLFIKDGVEGAARLRYSRQVKADGLWDPTKWESDNLAGGGFMDIRSGDGDNIEGLAELGNYLLIFKSRSTHVLAGLSPSTWTLRQLDSAHGIVYKRAVCELGGLAYFLSHHGLMVTDGAIVQEVPGGEVVRQWLRDTLAFQDEVGWASLHAKVAVWAWDQRIWISLPEPSGGGRDPVTLVYDPPTQSFWKLDFAPIQAAINRVDDTDNLYFIHKTNPALVIQYDHADAADTDDTGAAVYASQAIPWHATLGWLTFGGAKEQRRIRRIWTMLRADNTDTVDILAYRNFSGTAAWTKTFTASSTGIDYAEGQVMPDCHSLSFKIAGDQGGNSVLAHTVQTQFRRKRYHRS